MIELTKSLTRSPLGNTKDFPDIFVSGMVRKEVRRGVIPSLANCNLHAVKDGIYWHAHTEEITFSGVWHSNWISNMCCEELNDIMKITLENAFTMHYGH